MTGSPQILEERCQAAIELLALEIRDAVPDHIGRLRAGEGEHGTLSEITQFWADNEHFGSAPSAYAAPNHPGFLLSRRAFIRRRPGHARASFSTIESRLPRTREMRLQHFGLVIATLLIAIACGSDTPTSGRVTIETEIDFSSKPFAGTFEVTEGADVLGCSSGSFVDTPRADDIRKDLTCETGDRDGTFSVSFLPDPNAPGPGDQNGPWRILEGTGDFTGLQGEGDFSVVADEGSLSGVETLTGDIEHTS